MEEQIEKILQGYDQMDVVYQQDLIAFVCSLASACARETLHAPEQH